MIKSASHEKAGILYLLLAWLICSCETRREIMPAQTVIEKLQNDLDTTDNRTLDSLQSDSLIQTQDTTLTGKYTIKGFSNFIAMRIISFDYPYIHVGLLLLRIGIGISFVCHGFPKLQAGPELWEPLGGAMGNFGIHFAPTFWGFIGSLAEFGGGILILLGFLFRPTCIILVIQMIVATASHLSQNQSFSEYSHALEMAILFFCWLFIGPGRYSLDARFRKKTVAGPSSL